MRIKSWLMRDNGGGKMTECRAHLFSFRVPSPNEGMEEMHFPFVISSFADKECCTFVDCFTFCFFDFVIFH